MNAFDLDSAHPPAVNASKNAGLRLLIIDDDPKLCRLIGKYLGPLGYEVEAVHTGPKGLRRALEWTPDAVLLDVMLPEMDGFEVLKGIRHESNVPVLMLTGRGEETDRVVGLELGADDYMLKTLSPREMLARLRAVMRRALAPTQANQTPEAIGELSNGPLRLLPDSRTAALGDQPLQLTALEFDLLSTLLKSAGRVCTREQLLSAIADREHEAFDRSIDVHICALRQKLGDNPKKPNYIRTVRSVGYLMIEH
jgi:DNA-binding response OmpR family regulator